MHDQRPTTSPATTASVSYRGSYQRLDGGWDTIEITLPLGAPATMLDQAIEQWQQQRDRAMAALVQPSGGASYTPPAPTDPADLVITFGKYRSLTIGKIYETDPGYIDWLKREGREPQIRAAAAAVLERHQDTGDEAASAPAAADAPPPSDAERPAPAAAGENLEY